MVFGRDATEKKAVMACPYLKEVVMLFCDACPQKKPLPLDRIATANPCLGEFGHCPMFEEVIARRAALPHPPTATRGVFGRKERSS